MEHINSKGRPVIFGEALLDIFPNGKEILGGAPLNVAWHLQAFGYSPLFVSRIGNDERGRNAIKTLQGWSLDIQNIQIDSKHPTGTVTISQDNSGPSYTIERNKAYDHIELSHALANLDAKQFALLLHGTLALRSETSHKTLTALREQLRIPAFADLNRRPPWWNDSIVKETLKNATWVKVNEQELQEVSPTGALQLMEQYKNIEVLFVTLGAQGSSAVVQSGQTFSAKGVPLPATEVDTIGGGDAFTTVAIVGLLEQWDMPTLLQRANAFAADICQVPGATTTNRALYEKHLKSWQK